jgi:hypothetical protein
MSYNEIITTGEPKASTPGSGGASTRSVPVLAVVKDNIDPTKSGRIRVYIAAFSGLDAENSNSWVTVSFMTPYYGRTEPTAPNTGFGTFTENSSSYGIWNSPPDIGTTVVCIFINGDMNYGYYIGCVPDPETLYMVPAIGATDNVIMNSGESASYGGATRLPVTNINTNNKPLSNGTNFFNETRPVHSYVANILNRQGLLRDPIRGSIGSSSQRETPSRLGYGVSTPGRPIYAGGYTDETLVDNLKKENNDKLKIIARRGGHSLVMDDGDVIGRDQLVRLRTAMGHQILMSDDGQCLFIIHSNGQSWIELGKEGTIDMFSTNSVNIRTQGDLNLHADNNININAMKELNISADTINIESVNETNQRVGSDFSFSADGDYTVKTSSNMSLDTEGEASFSAAGTTYINGSVVNLNSGSAALVPDYVEPMDPIAHTDTLYDSEKGYSASPGSLLSIVSRAPAHAPWANAGQGVDVKTSGSAEDTLPSAPSAAIAETNAGGISVGSTPATQSALSAATAVATSQVVSTVPGVAAVSSAITATTTNALLAQIATNAAKGSAADAIKAGSGVIDSLSGMVAVVGNMAQTPAQMEAAGVLKTGSAVLVNSLTQQGKSAAEALTPNLFTGQGGSSLDAYISNAGAQAETAVSNLKQAQKGLTDAGAITGNESAGQISGVVLAAATVGVANTVAYIAAKSAAALPVSESSGAAPIPDAAIMAALVTSGNAAAESAETVTGGLASLRVSVAHSVPSLAGIISSAKGAAASAFSAITRSFKPFAAGVPQNLTSIATANAAATAATSNAIPGAASSALGSLTGAASSALGSLTGAASSALGSLTGAASSVTALLSKAKNAGSAVASGVNALPGGQNAISSVVNNAAGAIQNIPGTADVTTAIKSVTSAVTNGVSAVTSATNLTALGGVGGLTGGATALLGSATGAASNLMGSLTSGANTLSSLSTTGLSAAGAASLTASISALGGGGLTVKMPTVATNTYNTAALVSQGKALLGDSKIPAPNFSGVSASAKVSLGAEIDKVAAYQKLETDLTNAKKAQRKLTDDAIAVYKEAKNNLPQGDPAIARLKEIAVAEATKNNDLVDSSKQQLAEAYSKLYKG